MFNIISALFVRMIMKRHNKLIKKETAQVVLSLFSVPYCILNGLVVVLFSPVFFPNYFLSSPLFPVLVLRNENTNGKKRITSDHLNHILKTPYGEF